MDKTNEKNPAAALNAFLERCLDSGIPPFRGELRKYKKEVVPYLDKKTGEAKQFEKHTIFAEYNDGEQVQLELRVPRGEAFDFEGTFGNVKGKTFIAGLCFFSRGFDGTTAALQVGDILFL